MLGRFAASSFAEARDHRRCAPATGFAARSRRTRMIIDLGFESLLWGAAIGMAEREEAIPLRNMLFHNDYFVVSNIRTINSVPEQSA